MTDLLSRLIGITLLRLGPQDLPAGTTPLTLAVLLYLLATGLTMSLGQPPSNAPAVLILALLLPLVLVRIVLTVRGVPERWSQTLTALFGTSAILTAISLPLASVAGQEEPPVIAVLMSLAVFIWSFAVDAHIWRHALNVTFATGLVVAVVLFAITLFVIQTLAGPL